MPFLTRSLCTACGHRIAHRKWKENKLHPGTAGPGNMFGSCLVSSHFLWAILCPQAVKNQIRTKGKEPWTVIMEECRENVTQFGVENDSAEENPLIEVV